MDFTEVINLIKKANEQDDEDYSIRIKGNGSGWLLDSDGLTVFHFNNLEELCNWLTETKGISPLKD